MNNLTPEQIQEAIDYFNEVLPYMGGDRGLPHFATAIAALESAQGRWVPASEPPKESDAVSGMVLACYGAYREITIIPWNEFPEWNDYYNSFTHDKTIQYWHKLPQPPREEQR